MPTNADNRMTMALARSSDKATRWAELIDRILEDVQITNASIESLTVRHAFAKTAVSV